MWEVWNRSSGQPLSYQRACALAQPSINQLEFITQIGHKGHPSYVRTGQHRLSGLLRVIHVKTRREPVTSLMVRHCIAISPVRQRQRWMKVCRKHTCSEVRVIVAGLGHF